MLNTAHLIPQPSSAPEVLNLQIRAEFSTVKVTSDAINQIILFCWVFFTRLKKILYNLGGISVVSQALQLLASWL